MKTHWEKLLDIDFYTEGPALDRDGNLYFSTLSGGVIMKLDRSGQLSEWARLSCPNGQRIMENGHHMVCDTKASAVVELNPDGEIIGKTTSSFGSLHTFDTPNDLMADTIGGFYFTDSVRNKGQVFYIDPDGDLKMVAGGLDYPNGIALSSDGNRLYISESATNSILEVHLSGPGEALSEPELFAKLPYNPLPEDVDRLPYTANLPDGIAWDNQSRLWVAHYGMSALQVLDSAGELLDTVPTGIPATSNLCFSRDYSTIYVTGGYGEPGPGCVHKIFIEND